MIFNEEVPLSQHDVLDARECNEARSRVMALNNRWTQRSPSPTFFTLGAASYLDATKERSEYLGLAKAVNPTLHQTFAWLHEKIRLFFEQLLGETVFYDNGYALPGFHVFVMHGEDRSADKAAIRAHFDLQWMHAIPGLVPSGTLSFTLPVELPSGGASMEIWPTRYQEAVRMQFSATGYASTHASQNIPYVPGRIVVHDGYILHAIGGSSIATPKGYRITLQGHGARTPEGWLLYW